MKAPKEGDVVAQCLLLLNLRGICAFRVNSGAFVVGSGKQRRFVRMVRGAEGVSDILGLLPGGRMLCVEVKRGKNKPTEKQSAFLATVNRLGGLGLCVWSVNELEKALKEV